MPSATAMRVSRNRAALNLLYAMIARELSGSPCDKATCQPSQPCPRCASIDTSKRGRDSSGKQRYQCNACRRSFTSTTGSALSSTNLPLETWEAFAKCYVEKRTLRDSASQCNVTLKTAFYMRQRIDSTIGTYSRETKRRLQALRNTRL